MPFFVEKHTGIRRVSGVGLKSVSIQGDPIIDDDEPFSKLSKV